MPVVRITPRFHDENVVVAQRLPPLLPTIIKLGDGRQQKSQARRRRNWVGCDQQVAICRRCECLQRERGCDVALGKPRLVIVDAHIT